MEIDDPFKPFSFRRVSTSANLGFPTLITCGYCYYCFSLTTRCESPTLEPWRFSYRRESNRRQKKGKIIRDFVSTAHVVHIIQKKRPACAHALKFMHVSRNDDDVGAEVLVDHTLSLARCRGSKRRCVIFYYYPAACGPKAHGSSGIAFTDGHILPHTGIAGHRRTPQSPLL